MRYSGCKYSCHLERSAEPEPKLFIYSRAPSVHYHSCYCTHWFIPILMGRSRSVVCSCCAGPTDHIIIDIRLPSQYAVQPVHGQSILYRQFLWLHVQFVLALPTIQNCSNLYYLLSLYTQYIVLDLSTRMYSQANAKNAAFDEFSIYCAFINLFCLELQWC